MNLLSSTNFFIKKGHDMSSLPNDIDPFLDAEGPMNTQHENESWKSVTKDISSDVAHLIEKERQLIRVEMNEKISEAKSASVALIASGILLFTGVLCAAATAIIVLDLFTNLWEAAATVTVAFIGIGGVMFNSAKKKLAARELIPNKSIEVLSEIRESLQEKLHEIIKH
jgi:uncharacterized membrane protein YqjE